MTEEDYKQYIADIFLPHANERFGQMLDFLCGKSLLSQRELGRRASAYRKCLRDNGYLIVKSNTRDIAQSGISRVISGEMMPSYVQIFIWLHCIREWLKSEEYKKKRKRKKVPEAFVFTQEFEDDMWHMAKYATPREVFEVYKQHEGIIY